jgi:hypothetical protein
LHGERMPPASSSCGERIIFASMQDSNVCDKTLVWRHGRFGLVLGRGQRSRNAEIEPEQLEVISAAFAGIGVPTSRVVSAIESIIYESAIAGDGGALPSTEED